MLVDKDSFGDPRHMTKWVLTGVLVGALLVTKWVLTGVLVGALLVLITQIITKCMP
jgi:hypothetical protein